MVDVAQEHVQRLDPLLQPPLEQRPFLAGQDAGHHIERNQPFLGVLLAINRKGDADPAKQQFRLLAAIFQGVRGHPLEPVGERFISGAERTVRSIHFVERDCHKS